MVSEPVDHGVWLYWLPLGAGGWFVRLNGRVYEAVKARREGRPRLDLYHCALELCVPGGRYVVEMSWPIPAGEATRGVVSEGAVASCRLRRFRMFRYELRCWLDGEIPDVRWAVGGPQRLSREPDAAARILDLVSAAPTPVWGRDELQTGEMWNSNSVVSWLLTRSGLPTDEVPVPPGGRAPGWDAGVVVAAREPVRLRHRHRDRDQRPGGTAARTRPARAG